MLNIKSRFIHSTNITIWHIVHTLLLSFQWLLRNYRGKLWWRWAKKSRLYIECFWLWWRLNSWKIVSHFGGASYVNGRRKSSGREFCFRKNVVSIWVNLLSPSICILRKSCFDSNVIDGQYLFGIHQGCLWSNLIKNYRRWMEIWRSYVSLRCESE